jgi:hypothetical protein
MTKRHYFSLPHERRFAAYAIQRQRARRSAYNVRMEENYGPEGIRLFWFGFADGILGWAICVTGIVIMLPSIAIPPLWPISRSVVEIGCVLALIGLLRLAQGARAGRIYRDGRPYIRGPKSRYG